MRTLIYVDGFNLYFGSLKGTPCKWLNIREMAARHLAPHHQIVGLKYFTARLNPRPNDPDLPHRQALYLRALRTVPDSEIILGHFLTKEVSMLRAHSLPGEPPMVRVIKTEEKGSDVNLAVNLLHDAHLNRFDCAVVISGDSDLLASVRLVMSELKKPVGVLNPQKYPCKVLQAQATFYKHLRKNFIAASLFPPSLTDARGTFTKPPFW